MRYSLNGEPDAEAELAALWLAARDRQRLSEVMARVEERLGRSPETLGESREGDSRVLHDDPLGVLFEIDPQRRVVRILSVWRYD